MYKAILGLILGVLSLSSAMAIDGATGELLAIDKLIAKNDLKPALVKVNQGLATNKNDVNLLARKSRIQNLKGDNEKDEEKKVSLYEIAKNTADKLIELHPKSAKGYNRRAAARGKLILFKGILQSRTLVLEVRKDCKKVLELEGISAYDKALASYILGRAHIKLAKKPRALRMPLGLAWASKKKGGAFLKSAADLVPDSITFNFSYGKWLADNDKKDEAKKTLGKIEGLEVQDPAEVESKKKAKELLASL